MKSKVIIKIKLLFELDLKENKSMYIFTDKVLHIFYVCLTYKIFQKEESINYLNIR